MSANTSSFCRAWQVIRGAAVIATVVLLASLPSSTPPAPWQVYTFRDDSFTTRFTLSPCRLAAPALCPFTQPTWHVTASTLADVTRDGLPEWTLVVWRPWRDWPIQQWSAVSSPIADFRDAAGDSCHLILLDPRDGRQIWAGSALPAPLLAVAIGDVDGDGRNELATLEGDYVTGRDGPASRVGVWKWNGFGFTLEWHSSPSSIHQLCLTDADGDSILDALVR
jgi:hypothetical protein